MEPMVANIMRDIGQTWMIPSSMTDSWRSLIREAMYIGIILVLIQTSTMVIIIVIHIGGVTGDICRISSRNPSHLHLMEK